MLTKKQAFFENKNNLKKLHQKAARVLKLQKKLLKIQLNFI